ncbi:hypothetical protein KM043_005405 [Ampulex compressa]|nr:hypothetical protein KM043_005405 [Ampulex compressa]
MPATTTSLMYSEPSCSLPLINRLKAVAAAWLNVLDTGRVEEFQFSQPAPLSPSFVRKKNAGPVNACLGFEEEIGRFKYWPSSLDLLEYCFCFLLDVAAVERVVIKWVLCKRLRAVVGNSVNSNEPRSFKSLRGKAEVGGWPEVGGGQSSVARNSLTTLPRNFSPKSE